MTKQEEIRVWLEDFFDYDHYEFSSEELATQVIDYLHSQDVVIKVDEKLPIALQVPSISMWLEQLGFVAVEPLI